jgi:outer membrane protein OmpA-like peptidoglycan-associated protein
MENRITISNFSLREIVLSGVFAAGILTISVFLTSLAYASDLDGIPSVYDADAFGGWVIAGLLGLCLLRFRRVFLCGALVLASMAATGAEAELESSIKVSDWYIGAGMGLSQLEPDDNGTNFRVTNANDVGWKIFAGIDLSKHWTAELLYSDLGKSELTNQSIPSQKGEVSYSVLTLTSQYYFNQKTDPGFRQGWQPFLRAGISMLDAEQNSFTNVDVQQDHNVLLYFGAGIEYSWWNNWAVRAEIDIYDTDAAYAGISLLKRFGENKPRPRKVKEDAVVPEPTVAVLVPPAIVYSDVCTQFEGVNFWHASADLREMAKEILERVIEILIQNPGLQLEIQAHTDSKGTTEVNQKLSDSRADSVRNYLIENGIDGARLVARGYGESRPKVRNDTVVGRAENRRVEFRVTYQNLCE